MQISYKTILKEAWQITKKHKILWLFGVFASFISLEAVYEIILSQIVQIKNNGSFYQTILNLYEYQIGFLNKYLDFFNKLSQDFSAYFIFILMAIIIILFVWLAFTAQIFIIKSAAKLYHKKKLKINEVLLESYDKFWPVLGINILIKLTLYAGFLALSIPLLYALLTQNPSAIKASNIFFFIVFTVFAVIVSFLAAYATNFIVLKNYHLLESIKYAWKLFSKNITISLEIAFILFFLKLVSIILIFSLFFLAFIPLLVILLFALSNNSLLGLIISLTLIILALFLISLFINSIFTVFYLSSWTVAFIKLTEGTLIGKIINMVKSIPGLFNKIAKKYKVSIDKKKLKQEAKILNDYLEKKYNELKPKAKKQGKVIAKKLKEGYIKLEPKIEKEIKKIIAERKKTSPKKRKSLKKGKKKTASSKKRGDSSKKSSKTKNKKSKSAKK